MANHELMKERYPRYSYRSNMTHRFLIVTLLVLLACSDQSISKQPRLHEQPGSQQSGSQQSGSQLDFYDAMRVYGAQLSYATKNELDVAVESDVIAIGHAAGISRGRTLEMTGERVELIDLEVLIDTPIVGVQRGDRAFVEFVIGADPVASAMILGARLPSEPVMLSLLDTTRWYDGTSTHVVSDPRSVRGGKSFALITPQGLFAQREGAVEQPFVDADENRLFERSQSLAEIQGEIAALRNDALPSTGAGGTSK